jgi:outer membrane protein assembly factor BamB
MGKNVDLPKALKPSKEENNLLKLFFKAVNKLISRVISEIEHILLRNRTKLFVPVLLLILIVSTSQVLLTFGVGAFDVTVSGQNLQRTFYTDSSAPDSSNLLWKFQMNGAPSEFATAVVDGVVYQGCLGTGDVYAINQTTGDQIWHTSLNNTANSITYYDGKIYTQGGSLPYDPVNREFGDEWIALDAETGDIVWIYKIPEDEWVNPTTGTYGNPPIIVDGKMYIDVYNGIATLDPNTGVESDRWSVVATSFYNAYSDGKVYGVELNQTDGKFYAFRGDPTTKTLDWISKDNPVFPFGFSDVGAGTFSGVAFSDDLFVGEYNFTGGSNTPNRVFRIRASDGAIAWVFPIEGYVTNSVAVAYNNVYAATSAGNIYAVSKTEGTSALWSTKVGPVYVPIVVADNKVFVGSEDFYVYAFEASTGNLVWSYKTGGAIIGSLVLADGVLLAGSRDQYLYAFGPEELKPSSSITLSVPQTVSSGQTINVRGRLTDSAGAPIVLASVTFQQRLVPRTEWTNVTTLTTDANGNFTYSWTPSIDGDYDLRVIYEGDGLGPSSSTVAIRVGGAESTVDAINRLQTTLLIFLVIIVILAGASLFISILALRQAKKKGK